MSTSDDDDPLAHLPVEVADEIEAAVGRFWLNWTLGWLPFVVTILGFVVGYGLWNALEVAVGERALRVATEEGAWLYSHYFGGSLLVLLFAWIFLARMLSSAIVFALPRAWKTQYALGMLTDDNSGKTGRNALEATIISGQAVTSAAELSELATSLFLRDTARFALPLLVLAGGLLVLEFRSYESYSIEGLTQQPYLPWEPLRVHPWSDVESVALGCIKTRDGGSLIYEPRWPDGPSPRLASLKVVPGQSRLRALETIDGILVEQGASFERWKWLKRDPLHPKCLAIYRAQVGPERASRVDSLLRVGEYPGDAAVNDL